MLGLYASSSDFSALMVVVDELLSARFSNAPTIP
jgi:hypothetical protein